MPGSAVTAGVAAELGALVVVVGRAVPLTEDVCRSLNPVHAASPKAQTPAIAVRPRGSCMLRSLRTKLRIIRANRAITLRDSATRLRAQ